MLLVLALVGCAQPHSSNLRLLSSVERPESSVVVFFADGMDRARFHELLDKGQLPNIRRRFVDGGVGVEHAVVSLPPITYASAVSILTGCFPSHHGVLGNRWFDRKALLLRDYGSASTYRNVNADFDRKTLFEMLDDRFTVSVQTHTDRGADVVISNWVTSGLDWLEGDYQTVDARVGETATEVVDIANREGRWPSVYFNYFPGLDEIGHRFGSDSPQYAEAMATVDAAIGRIVGVCEEVGVAGRTYFVLLTDHGHVVCPEGRAIDLAAWLEKNADRHVRTEPVQSVLAPLRRIQLDGADTVLSVDAGRRAAIHLRGEPGWDEPAAANTIECVCDAMTGSNGLIASGIVAAACFRGDDESVVCDMRGGSVTIERRATHEGKLYRCSPSGEQRRTGGGDDDPASVCECGDGEWRDSRSWLACSAASRFPDFVPQIVEMFESPRAGDIVLFAGDDWTFDATYRGAHGSCLDADMSVPLYFAGPDLPAGATIPTGRLVDVMPTILDMLNQTDRLQTEPPIDGVGLLPELLHAE